MKKSSGGLLHCTNLMVSLKNPKAGASEITVLVLNWISRWNVNMLKGSNRAVGWERRMDSIAFSMYDSKQPFS